MAIEPSTRHRYTPTLYGVEPRGLTACRVDYLAGTGDTEPRCLTTRTTIGPGHRTRDQTDPRLGAQALYNLRELLSLSGSVLRSESVDAGTRVALIRADGLVATRWHGVAHAHHFHYDSLGRHIETTARYIDAVRRVERCTYAAPSPGARLSNACGQLTMHYYDAGQRTVVSRSMGGLPLAERRRFRASVDEPDWPDTDAGADTMLEPDIYTTHWCYDGTRLPQTQTDASGSVQATLYDASSRITETRFTPCASDTVALGWLRSYSADGIGTVEDTADGRTTALHASLVTGQLERVVSTSATVIYQDIHLERGPAGQLRSVYDGLTGTEASYTHDTLGRLVAYDDGHGAHLVYGYDDGNNLISVHDEVGNQRLNMAIADGSNRGIPVDPSMGNDVDRSFDDRGHVLNPSSQEVLHWNAEGRLRSIEHTGNPNQPVVRRMYDETGKLARRVAQHGGGTIDFRYVPGLRLGPLPHAPGTAVTRTPSRLVQMASTQGAAFTDARYALTDAFHNDVGQVDVNGTTRVAETFLPFGSTSALIEAAPGDAGAKPLGFAGHPRDEGYPDAGNRLLHTAWGRWLSPDGAGAVDGLNLYAYARNDPADHIDLSGYQSYSLNTVITWNDWRSGHAFLADNHALFDTQRASDTPVSIDQLTRNLLITSDHANALVRSRLLPYGPINQALSIMRTNNANTERLRPDWDPYRMHFPSLLQQATGVCYDHARVALEAVTLSPLSVPAATMSAGNMDHGFVILGDHRVMDSVVVDPWAHFPVAHRLSESMLETAAAVEWRGPGYVSPPITFDMTVPPPLPAHDTRAAEAEIRQSYIENPDRIWLHEVTVRRVGIRYRHGTSLLRFDTVSATETQRDLNWYTRVRRIYQEVDQPEEALRTRTPPVPAVVLPARQPPPQPRDGVPRRGRNRRR